MSFSDLFLGGVDAGETPPPDVSPGVVDESSAPSPDAVATGTAVVDEPPGKPGSKEYNFAELRKQKEALELKVAELEKQVPPPKAKEILDHVATRYGNGVFSDKAAEAFIGTNRERKQKLAQLEPELKAVQERLVLHDVREHPRFQHLVAQGKTVSADLVALLELTDSAGVTARPDMTMDFAKSLIEGNFELNGENIKNELAKLRGAALSNGLVFTPPRPSELVQLIKIGRELKKNQEDAVKNWTDWKTKAQIEAEQEYQAQLQAKLAEDIGILDHISDSLKKAATDKKLLDAYAPDRDDAQAWFENTVQKVRDNVQELFFGGRKLSMKDALAAAVKVHLQSQAWEEYVRSKGKTPEKTVRPTTPGSYAPPRQTPSTGKKINVWD